MRIITGTHRGRALVPPKDQRTTRPITDRVKEALFNRLMSLGMLAPPQPGEPASADGRDSDMDTPAQAGTPTDFHVIDAFSGTGSLGIEALSRGATQCTFIERDRDALNRLNRNLTTLGLTGRANVVAGSAVNPLWLARLEAGSVRLAFLDPPYAMMKDEEERQPLTDLMVRLMPCLEPGGVVVLRGPADTPPLKPALVLNESGEGASDGPVLEEAALYDGPASFTYGSMALHFYQRPME